jgi:crotonobetainyl-CoA:carnitine CoA-transferase CaiB-like acyl-CoA transferase
MRVASVPEAVESEQIRERGFYHTFDSAPGVPGKLTVPMAPYKMSMNKAIVHSPPPMLGQHTDEILRSVGYTEADISRMRGAGII